MVKRTLMALGLGAGLLSGAATAVHASTHAVAHPAAVHGSARPATTRARADQPGDTADPAGDADATAPCATDALGNETGDCQNSQNASGPQDTTGAPDSATAAGQDGPDSGTQAGQ